MPDAHVEMLLDCYKAVQEERTLDSGRLGKGAFHQVIMSHFYESRTFLYADSNPVHTDHK